MQTYQELLSKLSSLNDSRASTLIEEVSSYDMNMYESTNKELLDIGNDLDYYFNIKAPLALRTPKKDLIDDLRGECVGEHLYKLTYKELVEVVADWNSISKEMLADYEKRFGKTICPSNQEELEDLIAPVWKDDREKADDVVLEELYKLKLQQLIEFYKQHNFVCSINIDKYKIIETAEYLQQFVLLTIEVSDLMKKIPHTDSLECITLEELEDRKNTLITCISLYNNLNSINRNHLDKKKVDLMNDKEFIDLFQSADQYLIIATGVVFIIIIILISLVLIFLKYGNVAARNSNVRSDGRGIR